jgi:hypothetical protein
VHAKPHACAKTTQFAQVLHNLGGFQALVHAKTYDCATTTLTFSTFLENPRLEGTSTTLDYAVTTYIISFLNLLVILFYNCQKYLIKAWIVQNNLEMKEFDATKSAVNG